jgi:FHS family L-fucose permease-like MFS transporter
MALATPSPKAVQPGNTLLILAQNASAFVLVTGLFLPWRIPNNINDVLLRQFTKYFAISRFEAALIPSGFYTGCFLFSVAAAMAMRRYGYKFEAKFQRAGYFPFAR